MGNTWYSLPLLTMVVPESGLNTVVSSTGYINTATLDPPLTVQILLGPNQGWSSFLRPCYSQRLAGKHRPCVVPPPLGSNGGLPYLPLAYALYGSSWCTGCQVLALLQPLSGSLRGRLLKSGMQNERGRCVGSDRLIWL